MTRRFRSRRGDTQFQLSSGSELAAPALRVSLPWGVVELDPLRPGRITTLTLELNQLGDSTAPDLLGERIGSAADGETISVGDNFDKGFADLARAALVEWVYRWDPRNLAAEDLELDSAAALQHGGFTLRAFRTFDKRLPRLIQLVTRAADRPMPAALREELHRVAEAAIASLGPNHPRYPELVLAVDRATGSDVVPDTLPEVAALENLFPPPIPVAEGMFTPGLAMAASRTWPAHLAGTLGRKMLPEPEPHEQPFDWWQVPPRLLADPNSSFNWAYDSQAHRVHVRIPAGTAAKQPGYEPLIARLGRPNGEVVDEAPLIHGDAQLDAGRIRKRRSSKPNDRMVVEVAHRKATGRIPVGHVKLMHRWQQHAISAISYTRTALAAMSIGQSPNDAMLDSIEREVREAQARARKPSRRSANTDRVPAHDLEILADWINRIGSRPPIPDPTWPLDDFSRTPARPLLAELLLFAETTSQASS